VEHSGGESGNIEHIRGMYNKPTGCSTPVYGAPHKQTNKQDCVVGIGVVLFYIFHYVPGLLTFYRCEVVGLGI
jgi:hypothetical protein